MIQAPTKVTSKLERGFVVPVRLATRRADKVELSRATQHQDTTHPVIEPHGGVPRMQKLRASLVGAQGYQRFLLSKPVVGQNSIA